MNVINELLRICLLGCRHQHTYRERRALHGVQVMHLVCERCGYAIPALQRTEEEHRRMVEMAAAHETRVQRQPSHVVPIESGRQPGRSRRRKQA